MQQQLVAIAIWASLGLSALVSLPVVAAENVLLKYRGFSRAVPVADLAALAETGEPSQSLAALLNMAGKEPAELRSLLTNPLTADPVVLDKSLNSLPGEWMLDQLGESIHTSTNEANRQALRSALVLSASNGGQLTLLEVLQNYPTEEVVLEGDRIEAAYNSLAIFLQPLSIFF
jgi:hypothetical protein